MTPTKERESIFSKPTTASKTENIKAVLNQEVKSATMRNSEMEFRNKVKNISPCLAFSNYQKAHALNEINRYQKPNFFEFKAHLHKDFFRLKFFRRRLGL